MATFYGSDTACLSDLSRIDLQVTDPRRLIGERVGRALQTPRGGLAAIGDNGDRGWDVRQYVHKKLAPGEISVAQAQIAAECQKDEQVESAEVSMTLGAAGALTIGIQLVSSAGPFTLTLNVSALTVELIFGGA